MSRLIWTPAALRDLSRLHAFLAPKNPDAARRAISVIRQGISIVADHPALGRPVAEMVAEFREWPIGFGAGGYLVLYRIDRERVVILAVRNARETGY